MWWIKKNGNVDGPFSTEQIERRVKINMLHSLDKISNDKIKWVYVKDSRFWNSPGVIKSIKPQRDVHDRLKRDEMSAKVSPSMIDYNTVDSGGSSVIPDRFRLNDQSPAKSPNRRFLAALIMGCIVGLSVVGVVAYFIVSTVNSKVQSNSVSENSNPADSASLKVDFKIIKDKLVIIECDEGSGSGFLLEMDGKTYLMTNEHVVRSTDAPRARLLDGTLLDLGAFSVATDRDLARFEVLGCSVRPLELSDKLPDTGDTVFMYGNSLGGGVSTESKGVIQGVGPYRLEVSNDIVPGNSGSPLVSPDGRIIGVAAFIDRHGTDEWTVKKTRFEGTPRRFAVRFTNVKWKSIDRENYEQQIVNLNEFEKFWGLLLPYLCLDSIEVPESKLIINDLDISRFKNKKNGYGKMLSELFDIYQKRSKYLNRLKLKFDKRKDFIRQLVDDGASEQEARKSIEEYDEKLSELYEKVKTSSREMIDKRREVLKTAQGILKKGPWDAPQVLSGYARDNRNGCIEWYYDGTNYFLEIMNQKLKDLNKSFEEFEKGEEDDEQ